MTGSFPSSSPLLFHWYTLLLKIYLTCYRKAPFVKFYRVVHKMCHNIHGSSFGLDYTVAGRKKDRSRDVNRQPTASHISYFFYMMSSFLFSFFLASVTCRVPRHTWVKNEFAKMLHIILMLERSRRYIWPLWRPLLLCIPLWLSHQAPHSYSKWYSNIIPPLHKS